MEFAKRLSKRRLSNKHDNAVENVTMEFNNLRYTVRDRVSGNEIEILKGVSGKVEPNRLTVIMGSSGAGKTTLLDVLAGNLFGSGVVTGEVMVNGAPRRMREFAQISCYVLQRDVLLASATVRESIMLAALLKLPHTLAHKDKVQRVEDILKELELEGCQHTLIGDETLNMKGISGGQRRRVSVGCELVKSPKVLFLDEPTSGLDSEMAVSLIDTLVVMSRQNRTVCTSIHQPNSLITSKFDDFVLLHAGSTAYNGLWSAVVDYFAAVGCPCPQYVNPTDYFMSMLKEKGDDLVAAWAKQEQQKLLVSTDLEAAESAAKGVALPADGQTPSGDGSEELVGLQQEDSEVQGEIRVEPKVPWWYQVYVLSGRNYRMWWRNPVMFMAEISQYIFMAVFVGLVYLQVNDSLATGVNDRAASLWFAMAVLSFTPSYTAAVIWDKERLLLRRESQQGMYNVTAWFFARNLTVFPIEIAETALFSVVMYWMVGYVARAANFFAFFAAFAMFQLISECIGVMCAIVTPSSTIAILVLTFVLLFLLSFSGFLVAAVPVYFRWITKVSYLTYAYAAVLQNEFIYVTFTGADGEAVPGRDIYDGTYETGTAFQVNNGLSVGANLAVLFGLLVGTRCLAFVMLYLSAKLKRL